MLGGQDLDVLAYTRTDDGGDGVLVALNMSSSAKRLVLTGAVGVPTADRLMTLMANPSAPRVEAEADVLLPPFGVWVAAYALASGTSH